MTFAGPLQQTVSEMADALPPPPRRLLNLWQRMLDKGEVYRSPGRELMRLSLDYGVPIQREHPLHEGPFWYFMGSKQRAIAFIEAAESVSPKEQTEAGNG